MRQAIRDSGQMLCLQLLLTLQHWNIRYENKDKWSLTVCYRQSSNCHRFAHSVIACQQVAQINAGVSLKTKVGSILDFSFDIDIDIGQRTSDSI